MRGRRFLFGTVAFVLPSILLAAGAELAVRWRVTGGLVPALQSLFPAREAPASWLLPDPDLGYKLNPAQPYASSLGIRHAELSATPSARARLIVLGDSVAFDEDGFVALLRARLGPGTDSDVEVVNASIPGYTTHQERVLFERDLAHFAPDVVLLQYCTNDNHRFLHRLDDGGHWIIVPDAAGGTEAASWLPGWLEASYIVKRIGWRLRARERSEQTLRDPFPWRDTPEFGNAWRESTWGDQESEIALLRDAARRVGARLAIVAVPYEPQLAAVALERDRDYVLTPQRALGAIAAQLGVPYLDLHAAFVAAGETPLFRDGIHLTAAGHQLAAAEIEAFLARESLLEDAD